MRNILYIVLGSLSVSFKEEASFELFLEGLGYPVSYGHSYLVLPQKVPEF